MALKNKVLILLVVMALCGVCSAAVHKVGGSDGWTFLDYTMWSSTTEVHVNDTLLFAYNNKFHNVLQVTKQDFISCNTSSPIAVHRSGADMITLPKHGHYYFVGGAPGHCEAGQKVHIRVTDLPAAVPHGSPSASPTPHHSSSGAPSAGSVPNLVLAIACLVLMFSKFIV